MRRMILSSSSLKKIIRVISRNMNSSPDTIGSEDSENLNVLGYKEIPKRSSEILEFYRQGKTLQEIGGLFGITRERVRQIAKATIKQSAINESVLKGVDIDPEIFSDGISRKRQLARESKWTAEHPIVPPKERRWSKYYLACRSCGTTSIPHVRKGLCEECIGSFRAERREEIISTHNNKCDVCGKSRVDARLEYGRDFFITKQRDVQCLGCFRKKTGKILGGYSNYKWSRFHEKCKSCGTTLVPHVKNGLCENCSDIYSKEQRIAIVIEHGSRCDHCHIERTTAQAKQGRDLYVTRAKEVLCRNCFQKSARTRFFKKNPS